MTAPRPLALTTDPIGQLTWRIAIPASVGVFFNTLFNFADTYCAGLLGTDALAALSLAAPSLAEARRRAASATALEN